MTYQLLLSRDELTTTYYKKAAAMPADDVDLYLMRANAFAAGTIGGTLPADKIDANVKTAVAMAFEIFAKGETGKEDPVNGFITEAAPAGFYASAFAKKPDPLATPRAMLGGYSGWIIIEKPGPVSDRSVRFL